MVTQVNVLMKAQKNLLIVFQDFIVFSFFPRVFPHFGGFFDVIRRQSRFFFFSKDKSLSAHLFCVSELEEHENNLSRENASLEASSLLFGPYGFCGCFL